MQSFIELFRVADHFIDNSQIETGRKPLRDSTTTARGHKVDILEIPLVFF